MDLGLAGRAFIVTGGPGLATARVLLREGANVLVTGRTAEEFRRARELAGGNAGAAPGVDGGQLRVL